MIHSSTDLTLDKGDILLNATNTKVCLSVQHTADDSDCDADASRSYPIQLAQTGAQDYTVRFRHQTADITIDDCKYHIYYRIGFIALIYLIILIPYYY